MKKVLSVVVSLLLLWTVFSVSAAYAQATPIDVANLYHHSLDKQLNPKSAYVITQEGQVLYSYHNQQTIDPASTSKLMTAYLLLEAIKKGHAHANDQVKITPRYEMLSHLPNLTTFPLKSNQTYTIEQLMKQAMLESSNAATLVLAEKVYGDTSKFTDAMNHKAKSLGMIHTHFTNPSGANNQLIPGFVPKGYEKQLASVSTAEDMAILSKALIKNYPDVLKYTSLRIDHQYGRMLKNTNTSLLQSEDALNGAQGLKTGTSENGYNLVLTTKRNHLRINTVVMNILPYPSEVSKHARHKIANALTENAFAHYEYRKVIDKGEHEINGKSYEVKHDLYDVVPKDKQKYTLKITDNKLQVDYPRSFLKGAAAPSTEVKEVMHWGKHIIGVLIMLGSVLLLTAIIYIVVKIRK